MQLGGRIDDEALGAMANTIAADGVTSEPASLDFVCHVQTPQNRLRFDLEETSKQSQRFLAPLVDCPARLEASRPHPPTLCFAKLRA